MREQMRQISLVTEDNVVQIVREASTFDQGWEARKGMMRKRGDGREKTRKLWEKAAKQVGSARLLEALKRYLREEKEPTCGYPGLSVWLNGERYDHWLSQTGQSEPAFRLAQAPTHIREKIIQSLGEPFCASYLDPCQFHDDGFITPRTETAKAKLYEKRHELRAAGIMGIRKKE